MTSITKLALHGILSTLVGVTFSVLMLGLISDHQILFWFLIILLWVVIGSVNGILLPTKKDNLLANLFNAGFNFVITLAALLLFSSFAQVLLIGLNFPETSIDQWSIIGQSFLGSFMITIIFLVIMTWFSLLSNIIKNRIIRSRGSSPEKIEEEFYRKYDTPRDSGRYLRTDDKEDYTD
ncbi:MAG: hypothetical protein ACTSSH_03595 [Candidatus Heimdallarchaeota archaeon]